METDSLRCDASTQTGQVDSHCVNSETVNRITYLSKILEQKDDLLKLLLKEKSILECEKDLVQKKQLSAEKDKEYIVMRFAMAEKKIIDLKSQLVQAEEREKKLLKERDSLVDKLKTAKEEKMRISSALDAKSQEHVDCLKIVDALKTEMSSLETKYKWSTLKLKKELEIRNGYKNELQEDIQIPESNRRLQNNEESKSIMLTYDTNGQTNQIHHLELQLENANEQLKSIKSVLTNHDEEQKRILYENNKLHLENTDLKKIIDENGTRVTELQAKISDEEALKTQFDMLKKENYNLTMCKQYIQKQLNELRDDLENLKERESELLTLNQEMGSLNAELQNGVSLYGFENLAMSLENYRANQLKYECQMHKLQAELDNERRTRFEERLVMARHLAEKMRENDKLLQNLHQTSEEITAIKKKHSTLIRDLQREVTSLQKSSVLQHINKMRSESNESATDNGKQE